MIVLDLSILNQKGTPMFNSDTFANRPAFGIVGRIFISTDTAAIYRDTGTAWDLIADGGSSSSNIYNSNGTLSANRVVSSGGFSLTFNPATVFDTTLTAAINASSLALFGVNRLSYSAAFSANNIGALYGGASAFALQTFAGSATFANSNVASGGSSVNSIDFSTGGSTITMTQSSGIRVMSGQQNLFQYQGTNSGTITHAAISQNTGFYRPSAATGILTITNAYSHLINALDDYGAGFTFTNRWGIYQAGASDVNYFAATSLFGTTTNFGFRVDINGTARVSSTFTCLAGASVSGSFSSLNITCPSFISIVAADQSDARFIVQNTGSGGSQYALMAGENNVGNTGFSILKIGTGNVLRFDANNNATFIGSVGINAINNASSILQADSTTKGFLPPRMTTTEKNAIGTPSAGLIVYDTTLNKLCVRTAAAWETITSI